MLADWYFTSCLRYPPRTAAILHTLFDGLESSDPGRALAALQELGKADSWVRIYVLPKALVAAQQLGRSGTSFRRLLDQHLRTLPLPQELDELPDLVWEALVPDDVRRTVKMVAQCAAQIPSSRDEDCESLPYTELVEQAGATVLAACIERLAHHEGARSLLAGDLKADAQSAIRTFFDRVATGRHGRLAALLRVRALAQLDPAQRKMLVHGLAEMPGTDLTAEPDLCELSAELLMLGVDPNASAGVLTERCAAELEVRVYKRAQRDVAWRTFDQVRALRAKRGELRAFAWLGESALDNRPYRETLWAVSVWSVAARLAPIEFGELLSVWWKPRRPRSNWKPGEALFFHVIGSLALRLLAFVPEGTVGSARQWAFRVVANYDLVLTAEYRKLLQDVWQEKALRQPASLSPTLTALALATQRRLRAMIVGIGGVVSAQDALDLLESLPNQNEVMRSALAGTFVDWTQQVAMNRGLSDSAGGWIGAVPQFASYLGSGAPDRAKNTVGLLLKAFHPHIHFQSSGTDWQKAARDGRLHGKQREVTNRDILLSAPNDWRDWRHLSAVVDDEEAEPVLRITAALERALSIDQECPNDIRQVWFEKLDQLIAGAFEKEQFDRFVLLRLAEFPTQSRTSTPEGRKVAATIVEVLLQFGDSAQLNRLAETLTCAEGGEELRRPFVLGLAARSVMVDESSRELREAAELTRIQRERRFLSALIFNYLAGAGAQILGGELDGLRKAWLQQRTDELGLDVPSLASTTLELEEGEIPVLVWSGKRAQNFHEDSIRQAIEHADGSGYTLFYNPWQPPKADSVFQGGRFVGKNQASGMIVDFRGGCHERPLGSATLEIGDLAEFQSRSPGAELRRAYMWPLCGAVMRVTLRRHNGVLRFPLYQPGCPLDESAKFHEVWDPDISRAYWDMNGEAEPALQIEARFDGRDWQPVTGDRALWLARQHADRHPSTTFTFIKVKIDDEGVRTWTFALQPGELYRFSEPEFSAAAANDLRRLASDDGAHGLLVTLELAADGRFELARKVPPQALHQQLIVPFDDRNLRWKRQFDDGEVAAAWLENGEWWLATEALPGFPDKLRFLITNLSPPRGGEADVLLSEWWAVDQRQGRIYGRFVSFTGLKADVPPQQLMSFLQRLAPRQLVQLETVVHSNPDYALCSSTEGLLIRVTPESLDFSPGEIRRSQLAGRLAKVTWRKLEEARSVELDPADFAAFPAGEHHGFLARLPRDRTSTRCEALFTLAGEPRLVSITIPNLETLRPLEGGASISVKVSSGRADGFVQRLRVSATAAWRIEERSVPEADSFFLGEMLTNLQGESRFLWQSAVTPGLLFETKASKPRPPHLAVWRGAKWERGVLPAQWTAEERQKVFIEDRNNRRYRSRLAVLSAIDADSPTITLSGWATARLDGERGEVRGVALRCENLPDGFVVVERDFVLSVAAVEEEEPADSTRDPERVLAEIAASREPLDCTVRMVNQPSVRLRHPELRGQAADLLLTPSGAARVTENRYARNAARTLVVREQGAWRANCVAVPPLTLDEFRANHAQPSGIVIHPAAFYFDGPLDASQTNGALGWLFEFGFGEAVAIPAERLVTKSEFLLFHGDRIHAFRFIEIPSPDGQLVTAMDLLDVEINIEPANSTQIYWQAKEHRIVHALRVRAEDDGIRVLSVEGCNRQLDQSAPYEVPRAEFDDFREGTESTNERVVYARLDTEAFEQSHGKKVLFHHLRLSFHGDHCLDENELLLLRATEITPTASGNDFLLHLEPLDNLDPSDIGRDFEVVVKRRGFSFRESLLRRIAGDKEEVKKIVARLFMVRLTPTRQGASGSMLDRMPERRLSALHAHVSRIGEQEPVFGVVCTNYRDHLSIEFRPGIFFPLQDTRFEIAEEARQPGTLVRILPLPEGRFAARIASLGADAFFSQLPRPVVALPMDSKFKPRHSEEDLGSGAWWKYAGMCFSLGDFPNVVCEPVSFYRDHESQPQLRSPLPREWNPWMERRHPKFALVQDYADGRAKIVPGSKWFAVGALGCAEIGSVKFHPLDGCEVEPIAIPWLVATFADMSAHERGISCGKSFWSYHDRQSPFWTEHGTAFESVPPHSTESGPLFFERDNQTNELRLRYRTAQLPLFGIPLGEPLETLGRNNICELAVAGLAKSGDQCIGVWAEFAPGRVHLIPTEILLWRCGAARVPQGQFDIRQLGMGDVLVVRAVAGTALSVDFVEVLEWHRSPRALFGSEPALLPVLACNAETGSLNLGAGRFRLTLPAAESRNPAVWLSPDNELRPFLGQFFDQGRMIGGTCLLAREEGATGEPDGDQFIVLGAPGYHPRPDREIDRDTHNLGHIAFEPGTDHYNWRAIARLIENVGGALPVTIEHVTPRDNLLFFSLREQTPDLAPHSFCLATVVGFDPGGEQRPDRLLIWGGRGLLRRPFSEVIRGVPENLRQSVASSLIEAATAVILRADEHGRPVCSATEDEFDELTIVPELADGEDDSTHAWGLVVRSVRTAALHWLAADQLGWVEGTRAEVAKIFLPPDSPAPSLHAQFVEDTESDFISLIHTHAAKRECAELRPGAQLRVIPVESIGSNAGRGGQMLARSQTTGLLMRLSTERDARGDLQDLVLSVVAERRVALQGRVLLTVVPHIEYRHTLRLPANWDATSLGSDQACIPKAEWLLEAERKCWSAEELTNNSSEPLARRLCHASALACIGNGDASVQNVLKEAFDLLVREPEFGLLPALLLASALLAESQHQQPTRFLHLVDILGRRAMRSLHIEILEKSAHNLASASARSSRMFKHLHEILDAPLYTTHYVALLRWIRHARLSFSPDLRHAAAALLVALGNDAPWVARECLDAELLVRIVGLHNALGAILRGQPDRLSDLIIRLLNKELSQSLNQVRHRNPCLRLLSAVREIAT